jgi:hypothetical protein
MSFSFKYKKVKRPDGTEIKTPSIPITIFEKETIDTIGLIDSGADISAISEEMATTLGIDCGGKRTPAYGIGGTVESVETTMKITILKAHENYSFTIPVKVIIGQYDFPVLLGRAGFFDKFKIIFSQKEEKVTLKRFT